MALDPRGCGKSDRRDSGYDIPTLADDVASLCRRLAISKPVVVGHSLGGMIAIELAAAHPSLASGIIAVDRLGNITMQNNTTGLSRAAADSSGYREVKLGNE